jgi:hypothetical protein
MARHFRLTGFYIVILLTFASCATLISAEIVLRIFLPHRTMGSMLEKDPRQGYRLIAGARTQYHADGISVGIRINNVGLRQDTDVIMPKPPGERRVLIVGDSYVFGWGVEIEDAFISQFQKFEPKIHFLNGGHGGFATEQMAAFLEDHGFALEPDHVFFVMGPNDIDENMRVNDLYLEDSQGNLSRNERPKTVIAARSFVARAVPYYDWFLFNSYLVQIVRPAVRELSRSISTRLARSLPVAAHRDISSEGNRSASSPNPVFQKTWNILSHLNRKSKERNIPFTVTHCSSGSPVMLDFLAQTKDELSKRGVDYFSILEKWNKEMVTREKDTLLPDGHLNGRGNRLYADLAWPYWKERLENSGNLHQR